MVKISLTENKRLFRLLLSSSVVAGIIVLVVVAFSVFNLTRKKGPSQAQPPIAPNIIVPPKVNPETLPAGIKAIRQKIISSQIGENHGDILLYQTDTYQIEYIPTPNVFFVTINADPAPQAKNETQQWFLSFGLEQEDLCNLPVRFILGNLDVRKTNPEFTSLPDGCQ